MSILSMSSRDWSLEETSEGPRVVIPSPCLWPLALFFSVWLAGWTAGEMSAAKALWQIIKTADGWGALLPGGFLLVWLSGWTVGGVFAWGIFLFSLYGRETVTVRGNKLCIRPETFLGLGWTWKFDIPGMTPPKVTAMDLPEGTAARAGTAAAALPRNYAHIAIESAGKRWKLGVGMQEQRARDLLYTLCSRFGLPRERDRSFGGAA